MKFLEIVRKSFVILMLSFMAVGMLGACSSSEEAPPPAESGGGGGGGDQDMSCDEGDSKEECADDIF